MNYYVIYDKTDQKYLAQSDEAGFYFTSNLNNALIQKEKPTTSQLNYAFEYDLYREFEEDRYEIQTIHISIIDSESINEINV
jgi:fatty acid-binding protein DegV